MKYIITLFLLSINLLANIKHPKDIIVDLNDLKEGNTLTIAWAGKPVLIYKRTKKDIEFLEKSKIENYLPQNNKLFESSMQFIQKITNPNYYMIDQPKLEKNINRSKRKDIFVAIGLDSIKGIFLEPIKKNNITFFKSANFYLYDNSGKHYLPNEKLSSFNLFIPPHHFKDNKLIIGVESRINEYKEYNFDNTNYQSLSLDKKLWMSAYNCNLKELKKSIKENANPNSVIYDVTSIFPAISTNCNKKYKIITKLIEAGVELNICNKRNLSPLDISIYKGLDIVKLLVNNGAHTRDICSKSKEELDMFRFNLKNYPDIEEYLISKGYFKNN